MYETTLQEKNDPIRLLQVNYLQQLIRDQWYDLPKIKKRLEQIQLTPLTTDHLKMQFVAVQLKFPPGKMKGQKRSDLLHHTYQRLCWETAVLRKGIYPIYHVANPFMTNFLIIVKKGRKLEEKRDPFVKELQQNIINELKLESVIGIGAEVKGLKRLKNGYASSMLSWSQNTVSTAGYGYGNRMLELPLAFPAELERRMIQTIENSDMNSLRNQLESIFTSDKDMPIFVFTLLGHRILLLLTSIARKFECGGSSLQKYLGSCQMTLSDYTSREELLEIMEELAQLVMEVVRRTRFSAVQHIEAVRKYVEENFSNELSLSFLAELFHMNEPCLTELFKEHIGISLSNYVTRLRITKAELFLQQHELKLNDIARLVGYSDAECFTTSFQKYSGESAKGYRERFLQKNLQRKGY